MSDWEDVFGPGNGDWEVVEPRQKKRITKKHKFFLNKKKEFNIVMVKLGFKWCLQYKIIAFPPLNRAAVFLDRKSLTRRGHSLSRLIIEPGTHDVTITFISKEHSIKRCYTIKDKKAFSNAILVALDFKFTDNYPYINFESLKNDDIYRPLYVKLAPSSN